MLILPLHAHSHSTHQIKTLIMLSLRFSLPPISYSDTLSFPFKPLTPNSLLVRRNHRYFGLDPDRSRPPCVAAHDTIEEDRGVAKVPDEEEKLPAGLRRELLPEHVAVVMDGNRRWARMRGLPVGSGYEAGARALKGLLDLCCRWGIKVLTVFAFSSDNWLRPKAEVSLLMGLLLRGMQDEVDIIMEKNIRISIIGNSAKLPKTLQELITRSEERTKHNSGLQLIVALSYSGKYDIVHACQSIAVKVKDGLIEPEDINESLIEQELQTNCTDMPCPDLLIRTSGELRISNFLLWQLAYTELFLTQSHWPDFGEAEFLEALRSFQQRQRRYGRQSS